MVCYKTLRPAQVRSSYEMRGESYYLQYYKKYLRKYINKSLINRNFSFLQDLLMADGTNKYQPVGLFVPSIQSGKT